MCKKLIVLTLSLCLISSVGAATVNWDFENGNDHNFTLWCVSPAAFAFEDPNIAGEEALTGAGGPAGAGLPDAGVAWTVGPPDQFDGLIPPVVEGCHVVNGVLQYGPCNDPFGYTGGTPNSRGQIGYLNTYNLSQWGDNLHTQENDQIATSPIVILGENSVLTVWSHGGGSGTHAPEYDPDPTQMYTDGSSGIAVLSADDYSILAAVLTNGKSTLTEDTIDLSAFAGQKVLVDVVDAFEGGWGWLAVDEIQITNATSKMAAIVVANAALTAGFDQAQTDRLVSLGYVVTVVEAGDVGSTFTIDDCNALDLLLISESIGSSSADPLIGTSAAVIHNEGYGWDNWFFMGPAINIIWAYAITDVEIVNDTHPIAVNAGLSVGPMPFFDPANEITTELVSNLAPGAEIIAQVTVDGNDYAAVFAIDEGAELANGTPATSRSAGFSLPGQTQVAPEGMTDEAWALFDAVVAWVDPPPAPPSAAMVVSSTDLSAGFDQAQKDRLESLGYTVTVTTGSDVADGVFTAADAETFDVLVVSESIGSSQANNLIGANVPMMHQESYGWSRHFFTTGLKKSWTTPADGMLDVVDDTHPIIAGAGLAAGPVQFFTDPTINMTTDLVASLVPGAVNLAQTTDADANDVTCIFAIEAGTELADPNMVAANRVCGFSLPGASPLAADVMTDDAWALYDSAIAWLDQ